jgi:hypothetical protein
MKKILLSLIVSLASNCLFSQSANEIVSTCFEAMGGKNWEKIRGINYSYNVLEVEENVTVSWKYIQMRDGRVSYNLNVMDNEIKGGFDGEIYWTSNTITNRIEIGDWLSTEKYKRNSKDFPNSLFCAENLGYKIELAGEDSLNGISYLCISLEKKELTQDAREVDNIEIYYIDKVSKFLTYTFSKILFGPNNGKILVTKYSDYRKIDDVYFAFTKSVGFLEAGLNTITTYDKIEINPKVSDDAFKLPKK